MKTMAWGYATHPHELLALLKFKTSVVLPTVPAGISADSLYCYTKLQQTSRSFSSVILHLHPKLREAIAVFYIVCRAIDTIEDDMKPKKEEKIPHLRSFHEKLSQKGWNLKGYGDVPHEIDLLEQFDKVINVYATFPKEYQVIIADIAREMGNGMADFLEKQVVTLEDYDLYCYYVAGVVGEGLSRLFAASGLEDKSFGTAKKLWNSMGLFLQKTNIIRDYKEDVEAVHPRIFYPKAIWSLLLLLLLLLLLACDSLLSRGKYVPRVQDLKERKYKKEALMCLNEMVTNALAHVEDCLDYLDKLHEPSVFNFCAIPQVLLPSPPSLLSFPSHLLLLLLLLFPLLLPFIPLLPPLSSSSLLLPFFSSSPFLPSPLPLLLLLSSSPCPLLADAVCVDDGHLDVGAVL